MGLIDQIKADIEQITSDQNEFGVQQEWIAPTGETATITGLFTKHHLAIDPETGKQINVKNAHCSFSEKFLVDAGYPVRNSDNEVSLKNHLVRILDSTGILWTYKIQEWFPDRTIGLIVCILGDYE